MSISQNDMNELKRIATNTYDGDKACMHRIIRGIDALNTQLRTLRAENDRLNSELKAAKAAK